MNTDIQDLLIAWLAGDLGLDIYGLNGHNYINTVQLIIMILGIDVIFGLD